MLEVISLEKKYADFIGTKYCVASNTGTSALHLALEALELPAGSEVIVPEFTMMASAWSVVYSRLNPVFVDCDKNLLIDVNKIEDKITEKTKVLMVTHVYGRICEMDKIMEIAQKYNLRVIEDACEAQGAKYENKMIGSFDIGCFSFFKNKIICAEEGGAITTNDKLLAEKCKDLKNMSFGTRHDYLHEKIGFNYRMTNSQASMAIESLNKFDKNFKRRQEIEQIYKNNLPKEILIDNIMVPRKAVWIYDIKIQNHKDEFVKHMNSKNIAARHSFKPMSMQPCFDRKYDHLEAYKFSKEICYLPVNPDMSDRQVLEICEETKSFLQAKNII